MRNTCQVVDPNQFGAVKGSSTTFVLLEILQPVCQATDDYIIYARVHLIDFSKAFDHINHQIILQKLDRMEYTYSSTMVSQLPPRQTAVSQNRKVIV